MCGFFNFKKKKTIPNENDFNIDSSKFTLKGFCVYALCTEIYDGDTITVIFPDPRFKKSKDYKWKCRLSGIDTPEIRNKKEKFDALKARDWLRDKILSKVIKIECGDFDNFGRLLGIVYQIKQNVNKIIEINLNEQLVNENLAVRYS